MTAIALGRAVNGKLPTLSFTLPVLVAAAVFGVLVTTGTTHVLTLIEIAVAAAAVLAVSRRPAVGLGVLVVFLPLQQVLLAELFAVGMPAGVVRGLGGVKEVLVVGLALCGARAFARNGRRTDVLDKLVLGYLAVLVIYLVVPFVFPGLLDPVPFSVRLLALRADGLFALAFLGVRHAGIRPGDQRRVLMALLAVAAITGAGALYENFDSTGWNQFLVNVVRVPEYKTQILGVPTSSANVLTHGLLGDSNIIRVGSVLLSPLTLGFFLLVPLAVGLQRLTKHRFSNPVAVATALAAAGIFVTLTRSAILAAVIVAALSVRVGVRRFSPGRIRLALALVAVAVLFAPLAGSSNQVQRSLSSFSGNDASTNDHVKSLRAGIDAVTSQPFGRGLGTTPGIGERFDVAGRLTTENAYLQVGAEVGVGAMVLFIGMLVALVRRLRSRSFEVGVGGERAAALYAAGVALIVGGFFLHIWLDFSTAVTFWAVAGMVLQPPRNTGPSSDGLVSIAGGLTRQREPSFSRD